MSKSPQRILIIEDDADLNNAYYTVLGREGFEVACAMDGLDAINKLEDFLPDLMLLDLRMPRMDGLEFLRAADIKTRFPKSKVIIFTNFDFNDEIQEAFDLGATRYVLKAMVSPKQLANLVQDELA